MKTPRVITLAFFLLLAACGAGGVEVTVQPNPMVLGEAGHLQITATEDMPRVRALPTVAGLQWAGEPTASQSFQVTNFKASARYTVTYTFIPKQAGTVEIPAFEVQVGKQKAMTTPVRVQVAPGAIQAQSGASGGRNAAGSADPNRRVTSIDEVFMVKVLVNGEEKPGTPVFVSQELAVDIQVLVAEQLFRGLAGQIYPEVNVENASFRENSDPARNPDVRSIPQAARFDQGVQRRQIINGVPFVGSYFRCHVTPMAAGTVKGEVSASVKLAAPRPGRNRQPGANRGADDSLFDDFFAGTQATLRQKTVALPALTVLPLPALPASAGHYLGLIGAWNMDLSAAPATVRAGEPVTLTLTLAGDGSTAPLTAPKLEGPNLRSYEPEIKLTGENAATVTWVLVPLNTDAQLPGVTLATFAPGLQRYVPKTFRPTVTVQPGAVADSRPLVADAGQTSLTAAPPGTAQASKHTVNDILYVKPRPGTYFYADALWVNSMLPATTFAGIGVLAFAGCWFMAGRRERLLGSLSYRRRQAALRERRRVFRELENCTADRQAAVLREHLVPYLTALLDLPPGTTPGELAGRLANDHADLAAALRQAEQGDFRPGANSTFEVQKILAAVRRLACLLLLPTLWLAAPTLTCNAATPEELFAIAAKAYDRGDVEKAREAYTAARQQTPGLESPALLYNEANCAYRLNKPGEAIQLYERARRLAPRDSDTLENLNFVRTQLGLPRLGGLETPRELLVRLRDFLRPDEWLLLAAILLCAAGLAGGWLRWRRANFAPLLWGTAGTVLICLLAIWSQSQTTYRRDTQGVILHDRCNVYRVPDAAGEKTSTILHQGEYVAIVEQRATWTRVRIDAAEGWVEASALGRIW